MPDASITEFNNLIRPSIFVWAMMGTVVIPLCVYFDPFQGWRWVPFNVIYEQMIVSIYVAIGLMCFIAMRSPAKHLSFLWFIALSSFTHGFVMLFHAVTTPVHRGHLLGDVWIIAGGLSLFIPLALYAPSFDDAPNLLAFKNSAPKYGSVGKDTKLRVSDEE
jgi:hypothetical protein